MTLGAKILTALAGLCFLAWGIAVVLDVRPLVAEGSIEVVYGVQEDFRDDGRAYHKLRNENHYLVHLPHAAPGRRWWTVDFQDGTIAEARPPRTLAGWYFVTKGDLARMPTVPGDEKGNWIRRVDGTRAAFALRSLTCLVRRTGGD